MQLSQKAMEFLEGRGLDVEIAARLGINSKRSSGGEVLAFPYYVGGQAVNHKYRNLDEKAFRQDKDGTCCFWNFDSLLDQTLDEQPLIITEGELDAFSAIQAGYARSVSVPTGAPSQAVAGPSTKYDYLEHAKKVLKGVKEIILAVDSDGPGMVLFNDLAVRLGKARCKFVTYPAGCKDLNEVLVTFGEDGVRDTIRHAKWCEIGGLYRLADLPPYAERDAVSTGMEWLDEHYRVRMGDFTVVTGVPGDGKSTFVNDLC
jgi:twinkle protein